VKRIDTSASFFLSIEFQQTGFLSYRTHAAAFGTSRVVSTVPAYAAGIPDRHSTAGERSNNWQRRRRSAVGSEQGGLLQPVRDAPEFVTKYPAGLTNDQYVDNLLASAGLSPSQVRLFVVNLTNSQEVPPRTQRYLAAARVRHRLARPIPIQSGADGDDYDCDDQQYRCRQCTDTGHQR
jgi:hypothetical protein